LLKWVELGSTGESVNSRHNSPDKEMGVAALIARGFDVLEKAAKER
jgi:hypothetical protein